MEPFVRLTGIAAPLPINDVDTDAIIPSRETQSVARTGYAEKLFANWRYQPGTRIVQPGFVLNRPPFDKAVMLVSGRNFGCGSSREAAVWSLVQFGIRAVIAESFGTIFRNNCIRNGLLPVTLPLEVIERLLQNLKQGQTKLTVDLEQCQVVTPSGERHDFTIDPLEREMLLKGADEISVTLDRRVDIEAFRERDRVLRPWVYQEASDPPREQCA